MKKLSLCGKWNLQNLKTGETIEATVPGLNFLDLMAAGKIGDPYKSESDKDFFFVSETAWKYSKTFSVSKAQLKEKFCFLVFERLDTLATVTLNGETVLRADNIHKSYKLDVKALLKEGENLLCVTFDAIRDYIKEKQKKNKLPFNANGILGHPHIRKCGYQFGWDFAPEFAMQGISGNCEIQFVSQALIENLFVFQKISDGKAEITARCDLFNSEKEEVVFSLSDNEGKTLSTSADGSFVVENPRLWWCNGLGEQPLYKVTATLLKNGKVIDTKEKRIGLRTITLDTKNNNFQFIINGVPIFSKGANYVPMDSFYTRITKEKVFNLLSMCKEANMNMIRVWGGGFYESDDFYDLCDELGLLIWQDFAFACYAFPFMEEEFLKNVQEEICQNVPRIMHHACLAIWCGNNEIESHSMGWLQRKDCIDSTGEFFYKTLPSLLRKFDSVTPYHACSPGSEDYMKLINSDKVGDTHIWNVWHGYQSKNYFRKRFTKFCSEFGMQSYPTKETFPHQKCDLGEERLEYYLSKHFTLPKTADEKRYLTQLLQLEAMKEATEHFRRNMDRCHGALYWQLNDCWDVVSWAAVDFYHRKKALMYETKKFDEPIHVSAVKKRGLAEIWISNDLKESFFGRLTVSFAPTDEAERTALEREISLFGNRSEKIVSLKIPCKRKTLLVLRLFDSTGRLISENRFAAADNNRLLLSDPALTVETVVKNGKAHAIVSADKYARYVELESENGKEFSENFFDLSAKESKTVEILDADLSDKISATSLYDCMKHKNEFEDLCCLLKRALMPMAIANRVSRWFDK
ncbi:MAG: hypothetical protein IJ262_00645 [Clostridia bacterium]|nr:hypothetical protein [Clostridia bacterium]